MPSIKIVPIQFAQVEILEDLLPELSTHFRTEVILGSLPRFDLSPYFNPVRSQYDANEIIVELNKLVVGEMKIVGVTDLDLFIPVVKYIFGQAYLGGNAALISGYRLYNSRYGLPEDLNIFADRLKKCMIHELGHAFGLIHCQQPGCVMLPTTYVEEMDQKLTTMCSSCFAQLRENQR
ncbi:MAG: archaemetzincin [Candidatus Marinimicrobia bacterium]|nr:archaemetzincin [Candidatus Neomarinimicrobiota bacterium]